MAHTRGTEVADERRTTNINAKFGSLPVCKRLITLLSEKGEFLNDLFEFQHDASTDIII
jgi:hypothetical protein